MRCDLPTRVVLAALAGLVCAALRVPEAAVPAALVARPRAALLLAAAVAAGWGALRVEALDRHQLAPGRIAGELVVTGRPDGGRALGRLAGSHEDVLVIAPQPLRLGGHYRIEGTARPIDGPAAGYYAGQGAHLELRAGTIDSIGRRRGGWGLIDALHHGALARLGAAGRPTQQRSLVAGVTLGDDSGLDDVERERFRTSGLSHIVAVSGQNVALVVAFTIVTLGLAGLLGGPARWTALAVTVLYVLVTGAGPSVVRAGVAGGLTLTAWLVSRPVLRWHLVACGAVAVLAVNPLDLFNPGFQLSFAAVTAIMLVAPRFSPGFGQAVAISVACSLATAPIAWWHFGRVAPMSVPANLLALPAVAPILALGLAAVLAGSLWPPLAAPLLGLADILAAYVLWVAGLCSG
ncbi:MAG TPA: ComEC/Rec2 family competence protein [Gaiellales bacterium]|nr:ComEC/Rec2 family competence protein [Gaiellales bacterium]